MLLFEMSADTLGRIDIFDDLVRIGNKLIDSGMPTYPIHVKNIISLIERMGICSSS